MSYISKKTDLWSINSFDPVSKETSTIINTVEGSEDLTWTNNGVILMSDGNSSFSFHPGYDKDWKFVIDWKYKQELGLRSSISNNHLKKKLYRFIQFYEKLSKWMFLTSPSDCNVLVTLDKKQTAKKITYK